MSFWCPYYHPPQKLCFAILLIELCQGSSRHGSWPTWASHHSPSRPLQPQQWGVKHHTKVLIEWVGSHFPSTFSQNSESLRNIFLTSGWFCFHILSGQKEFALWFCGSGWASPLWCSPWPSTSSSFSQPSSRESRYYDHTMVSLHMMVWQCGDNYMKTVKVMVNDLIPFGWWLNNLMTKTPKSVQALANSKTEKLELWTLSLDRFVQKNHHQLLSEPKAEHSKGSDRRRTSLKIRT